LHHARKKPPHPPKEGLCEDHVNLKNFKKQSTSGLKTKGTLLI
jgi:hypothetical protein